MIREVTRKTTEEARRKSERNMKKFRALCLVYFCFVFFRVTSWMNFPANSQS
jgi:hypothetical protein